MDITAQFIKTWSTLPIDAVLTILLFMLVRLVQRLLTNHMDHLQKDMSEMKEIGKETLAAINEQTEILKDIRIR